MRDSTWWNQFIQFIQINQTRSESNWDFVNLTFWIKSNHVTCCHYLLGYTAYNGHWFSFNLYCNINLVYKVHSKTDFHILKVRIQYKDTIYDPIYLNWLILFANIILCGPLTGLCTQVRGNLWYDMDQRGYPGFLASP